MSDDGIGRVMLGRMHNPVRGILHGSSAIAAAVGAVFLWSRCAGDLSRQVALLVFGLSLVTLYTVSSLYHSVPWRRVWKDRMQRTDHAMIYVLIAGSYTPMAFIALEGSLRTATLVTVWSIALIGIAQKVFLPKVGHWFSVALPSVQGWLALPLLAPLAERLPQPGFVLLVVGGLLYMFGLAVFLTRRPRLWPRVFSHHELFHVFVVGGSAAHYAATFSYLAPFVGS